MAPRRLLRREKRDVDGVPTPRGQVCPDCYQKAGQPRLPARSSSTHVRHRLSSRTDDNRCVRRLQQTSFSRREPCHTIQDQQTRKSSPPTKDNKPLRNEKDAREDSKKTGERVERGQARACMRTKIDQRTRGMIGGVPFTTRLGVVLSYPPSF